MRRAPVRVWIGWCSKCEDVSVRVGKPQRSLVCMGPGDRNAPHKMLYLDWAQYIPAPAKDGGTGG